MRLAAAAAATVLHRPFSRYKGEGKGKERVGNKEGRKGREGNDLRE